MFASLVFAIAPAIVFAPAIAIERKWAKGDGEMEEADTGGNAIPRFENRIARNGSGRLLALLRSERMEGGEKPDALMAVGVAKLEKKL